MKAARVPSLMPCREPWMRLEQRKPPRRSPFSNRRATNSHQALTRRLPPHLKNQGQPLTPSKCFVPKSTLPPPPKHLFILNPWPCCVCVFPVYVLVQFPKTQIPIVIITFYSQLVRVAISFFIFGTIDVGLSLGLLAVCICDLDFSCIWHFVTETADMGISRERYAL